MAEAGSGSESGPISWETFTSYKHKCTVRQIQKKYEELVADAQSNNRGVLEEMKSRGFEDYAQFNESCDRFPLGCRSIELAELGSGYVLYFHFMKFVGLLMAAATFIQLPAMFVYSGENWLHGWQWSTWGSAFSTEDLCACLGSNDGIDGLPDFPGQADYGKQCAAWDAPFAPFMLGVCPNADDCPAARPGKWMCRRWCFASPSCPTPPNSEHPSMTNVHYLGFVKSYSRCARDGGADDDNPPTEDSIAASCEGFLSADVVFNETGADFGAAVFGIGSHWMTVGNFGPSQATNTWIPVLYFVLLCVICAAILFEFQRLLITDHQVDEGTTSPNDFAMMVRGLPRTATDERGILQWFRENSLPGRTDTEIVKVVIGWDVEEFRDHLRKLKELSLKLKRLGATHPEAAEVKEEMIKIRDALNSAAPDKASRLKSSGIVIVTFRHQKEMRACLNRWNSLWGSWFYSDGNGCCKGERLPMYPIGDQPVCRIRVERAANPGDINWEDLGVDSNTRYQRLASTNFVMFFLIVVTILIVYFVSLVQKNLNSMEDTIQNQMVAAIPAMIVAGMNMALKVAARRCAIMEYHDTKTDEEASMTLKMGVSMILTTAGVLLFSYWGPEGWYQNGGLASSARMMLLINAVFPALFPLLQPKYRLRCCARRKLTQSKIDHFNDVLRKGPPKDPAQLKEYRQVTSEVEWWKRTAFAPDEMDRPRRLADALKTTVVCLFFSPMIPWIPCVGVVGALLQYWVDKYMLLRVYTRSDKPANRSMAVYCMRFLKLALPVTFAVGSWLFLTPSWKDKTETLSLFILALIVSGSFSVVVPMSVWANCLLGCKGSGANKPEMDYYQAQYMWSKELKYHKNQFIYAKLSEEVNPEYLQPGSSAAAGVDDFKASYTDAAAQAADAAAMGAGATAPTLKGGTVIQAAPIGSTGSRSSPPGGSGRGGGGGGGAAVPAPAPAVYGVVGGGVAEPEPAAAGPAVAEAAAEPLLETPDELAKIQVTWEFQFNDRWHPFKADCQSYIEKRYQEFQAGSNGARFNVNTSGMQLSIDFEKMSQMKKGSHKTSPIRRQEG